MTKHDKTTKKGLIPSPIWNTPRVTVKHGETTYFWPTNTPPEHLLHLRPLSALKEFIGSRPCTSSSLSILVEKRGTSYTSQTDTHSCSLLQGAHPVVRCCKLVYTNQFNGISSIRPTVIVVHCSCSINQQKPTRKGPSLLTLHYDPILYSWQNTSWYIPLISKAHTWSYLFLQVK